MVFYLAFANDKTNFLKELVEEELAIRNELFELEQNGALHIEVSPEVTINEFFRVFMAHHNKIRVFHFGGHSNQEGLLFEQEFARGDGLARLISMQKNLRLVFLNGCSTNGHVERLLKLGAEIVIATSASIIDSTARNFAQDFYSSIATNHTILESFDSAIAKLEARGNIAFDTIKKHQIHKRDIISLEITDPNPWGLFYVTENQSALNWRIAPNLKSLNNDNLSLSIRSKRSYEKLTSFIHSKVENQLEESYSKGAKIDLKLTNVSVSTDTKKYDVNDIERIFNERGEMLIIGEPGAGKSNIALQVAKKSINDIKSSDMHNRPIPVQLNLATWAIRKKPIDDWIASELSLTSNGPLSKRNAKKLVKQRLILPILDGLDQVPNSMECFEFILNFQAAYTNLPLLLTCRTDTYNNNKEKLNRYQAIFRVDSLNKEIIDAYLSNYPSKDTEASLQQSNYNIGLRNVPRSEEFYKLLDTPLLLTISSKIKNFPEISPDSQLNQVKKIIFEKFFHSAIEEKEEDEITYKSQNKKQILNWFSWLAKNGENKTYPAESFSENNLRPGWLIGQGKNQILPYFMFSRIIQSYIIFFCFSIKMVSISFFEFILAGLFSGTLIAWIDYFRLIRSTEKRPLKPVFQVGIFFVIFCVCGLFLAFLFGLLRDSPTDEKVFELFSTNGINVGLLCSILISGIFGWRGWKQESEGKDILPETNFYFNPSSAFKGALSYGLGFGIFLLLVFLMILRFGSDSANKWLFGAANLYIHPYTEFVGNNNPLIDLLLLALVGGFLYGGAFGFLLSGQQGIPDPIGNGFLQIKKNSSLGIVFLTRKLFTSPFFLYSLFCIGFFFTVIVTFQSGVSLNDLLVNSILSGIAFSMMLIVWQKGFDLIQASTLRFFLYNQGVLPSLGYKDFLEYGIKLSFLRRKGNEYEFYHNEIRHYLASFKSEVNINSISERNRNNSTNTILSIMFCSILIFSIYKFSSQTITSNFFPKRENLEGYKRHKIRVGDNISSQNGVLLDSVQVGVGDTIVIDAWGFIHPGDFITWTSPQGTKIGLFGFPHFGAYDIDNLEYGTPLARLLWRVSGEQVWHPFRKGEKIMISKEGKLFLNLNGRHFQKFKGKFYISVFLKKTHKE